MIEDSEIKTTTSPFAMREGEIKVFDGKDGYTPVRGTDYWTATDIAEIKSYVDEQLGVIENGSY